MKRLLLALVAASLLAAAAPAQDTAPAEVRPAVDAKDVTVTPYTPKAFLAAQLHKAASELFGEQLLLINPAAGAGRNQLGFATVPHFVVLGDLLLVRDTSDEAAKIVATLTILETQEIKRRNDSEEESEELRQRSALAVQHTRGDDDTDATESAEFRPRYVSFKTLVDAVKPFERQVRYIKAGGSAWDTTNLNVVADGRVIVACETALRMRDLKELVDRIDRPRPQMMVTITLLRPASPSEEVDTLPKELDQNLKTLLPARGFTTLAVGALRCAMESNRQCEMKAELEDGGSWTLAFFPDAFNPETSEFSLSHCEFQLKSPGAHDRPGRTQSFDTSLTFKAGEFVVLGGVGETPTLVALRAQLVGPPH